MVIIPLTSAQDEATRVLNEIRAGSGRRAPRLHPHHHTDAREANRLFSRLRQTFGTGAPDPVSRGQQRPHPVCSLHAAMAGGAIVFLMGVRGLYEAEQSVAFGERTGRADPRQHAQVVHGLHARGSGWC